LKLSNAGRIADLIASNSGNYYKKENNQQNLPLNKPLMEEFVLTLQLNTLIADKPQEYHSINVPCYSLVHIQCQFLDFPVTKFKTLSPGSLLDVPSAYIDKARAGYHFKSFFSVVIVSYFDMALLY
jgi:hypothetical protein